MKLLQVPEIAWMLYTVIALLTASSVAGAILRLTVRGESARATVANLNARTRAWWVMCLVFALAMITGRIGSVILFGLTSFLALREYVTLTPTRRADHRSLFWAFFVILPIQYYLLYIKWYGMFSIFIPVYAFLFIPARIALRGDCERFLERTSEIQWGLMVCVYFVSHAPGLLLLDVKGYADKNPVLLLFLVMIVQVSDVFQYVWGKMLGRRKIAPHVSPNKTVAGTVGGILTATAMGTGLWWATPFRPEEAAGISLLICIMGFLGGLVMSAVKRDRGAKDYGSLIPGHGGVMDRIDSLCFAAPVFFHFVRYFHT